MTVNAMRNKLINLDDSFRGFALYNHKLQMNVLYHYVSGEK